MLAWHSSKNIMSMWHSIFSFPRHWGLAVNVFLCSCITLIISWALDLIKFDSVWIIVYEIVIFLFCIAIAKFHLFFQKKCKTVIRDPKQDDRPIKNLNENQIQEFEYIARKILKHIQINSEIDNHGPNVALIGPFGSGKTSLCNLIEDIYKNHNNDSKERKIIFCRFEAWQYLTADAAVRGLLDHIVSQIKERVDSFQLNSIPERYLDALGACPHWIFRVFSILLKRKKSSEEIVYILQNILLRINKKVVVFVDDLDRLENHSPQAQDAVAAALNQLQNLTSVQYILCVGPSVILDREGTFRKCNYDLLKSTRFQELVPSLQGKYIIESIKALRDKVISSDENMVYIWHEKETHDPLKYNPMIDHLENIMASQIIRMIQTPRQLKTVERETRDKWKSLKGEISWYDLLIFNIIKACELPVFEWIINEESQFLDGPHAFFKKDDEKKKKELRDSIEQTLKDRMSVKTEIRFKLVRQILLDLFPNFMRDLGGTAEYLSRNEAQEWEQRICINLLNGISYFERLKSGQIPEDTLPDQYILQYIKKIENTGFEKKEFEQKFLVSLQKLTNDINHFKQFSALLTKNIAIDICDCILDWICNREHWNIWNPIFAYPSSVMSDAEEILDKAGKFHSYQLWKQEGKIPENRNRFDEWITKKLNILLEEDIIVAYYYIHSIAVKYIDEKTLNEIVGRETRIRFFSVDSPIWEKVKGHNQYLSFILKMLRCNNDYDKIRDKVTQIIIQKIQLEETEELKSSIVISLIGYGSRPDSDNPNGIFVNKEHNKSVYNMSILLPLVASWKESDFNDPEVEDAFKRLLKAYESEINIG